MKQWYKDGDIYANIDVPTENLRNDLLPGVYELNASIKGFYLTKISNKFVLPSKIYETEKDLIERTIHTFNSFDKNFGILLKGLKGTGKTIVSKDICNRLNLPVILINQHFSHMGSFLNSIQQDVIFLFDEFEKTYSFYGSDVNEDENDGPIDSKQIAANNASVGNLLTLMDGVFTSNFKRLFILTTNKEYLPDAMLSRPSRIRYIKSFTDLGYDVIKEILEDLVEEKALIPKLLLLMKDLEFITVDIVKCIAEEANLYKRADKEFFSIFNLSRKDISFDLVEVVTNSKGKVSEVLFKDMGNFSFENMFIGYTVYNGTEQLRCSKIDTKTHTFTFINAMKKLSELSEIEKKGRQFKLRLVQKTHKSLEVVF